MTVSEAITTALRLLGVAATGETLPYDEASEGLASLNRLVDRLAANDLTIYTVTRSTFTIVSGTQTYTVGTGGTVNIARPVYIDHVTFQDTSPTFTTEYPLQTETDDSWSRVVLKTLTAPFPSSFYYNPTYPLGTLKFWPVPTSSTLQGVVYAMTAVTEFAALTDDIALPPGYRSMLISNLAVQLAPEYGREISQALAMEAVESMATVKRANLHPTDLTLDAAVLKKAGYAYSIYTDH